MEYEGGWAADLQRVHVGCESPTMSDLPGYIGPPWDSNLHLLFPTVQVGVLTRSVLDDGRGLARSKVFKHGHESDTGGWGLEVCQRCHDAC